MTDKQIDMAIAFMSRTIRDLTRQRDNLASLKTKQPKRKATRLPTKEELGIK